MNTIWNRYSKGEILKPTFDRVKPKLPVSNIPPPPEPQKPKMVKQGIDPSKVIKSEPVAVKSNMAWSELGEAVIIIGGTVLIVLSIIHFYNHGYNWT